MEKTWRWFGQKDPITLEMLRQIGVEGIVTSLHHISNGDIWSMDDILETKNRIENAGLRWSVVESLPVAEEIKFAGANRDKLIENYCISLANLGKAGIKTVVYNFMPVIDWIRTDLNYRLPDGTQTLYFDKIRFAYFDCHILKRQNAEKDYSAQELLQINELQQHISEKERAELIDTIIVKTQGFVNESFKGDVQKPVELFRNLLALYQGIDKEQLRQNLKYFLTQVLSVAEQYNIHLCIHPDDPPYPVLGLPRITGNAADIEWILNCVNSPSNGLNFCAGSLSSGLHNDVIQMAQQFASRTHFVHLRSTEVFENGNFMEASHLEGRGHLVELAKIFESENRNLPFRVDHGKLMLDDGSKGYNPGYSFLGRMYALAQISGILAAIK
ncbi:MAG: mannonate dehydratase [Paludibacter sp.]|jgi:mannonate dehydratase|nr:mannonate dehydratase [Paludibacter sp.]